MIKNNLHIKADRELIRQLLLVNAIDDVTEFNKMSEKDKKATINYWVEHYYDDYTLEDLKEEKIIDGITYFKEKMREEYDYLKLHKEINFLDWYEELLFDYYLGFLSFCNFELVINNDNTFSIKDTITKSQIEKEKFSDLKNIVKKIKENNISKEVIQNIKSELSLYTLRDIESKKLQEKILSELNNATYGVVINDLYELIEKNPYFIYFGRNCDSLKLAYYIDELDEFDNADLIKKYIYDNERVKVNDLKYIQGRINELSLELNEGLEEYLDDVETTFGNRSEVIQKLEQNRDEALDNPDIDSESKEFIIQETKKLILKLNENYNENDFVVLTGNSMIDFYAIQENSKTLNDLKDIKEEIEEIEKEKQEEIKKNTIFKVITHDDYIEEGINSSDVKVFKDEEIAKKYLNRLISKAKQDIEDYELEDYEISEDENSYERFLKGRACEDYVSIKFEKDTFFDERELTEEIKELHNKIKQNELEEAHDEEEEDEEER